MCTCFFFCILIVAICCGVMSCSRAIPEGRSYPVQFEEGTSGTYDSIDPYSIPESRSIEATKTMRKYQLFP